MGGDRRSPPRRRGRGDGGGRLKGSMGVSVLARGRGIMTGLRGNSSVSNVKTQYEGAAVETDLNNNSVLINNSDSGKIQEPVTSFLANSDLAISTGVKLKVSGPNVIGQQENSVTDFHCTVGTDLNNNSILINNSDSGKIQESVSSSLANSDLGILDSSMNCIINTGDVLSSEGELDGERYESESLPVQCMNLESQCNNKTGSSHFQGISVDKVFAQEEGSEPVLFTDGRKDSDHSAINRTMKLPTGMILNVLNPMFVKDTENTRLDGDCEMMLNGEEEFCINQNSENQVNMAADTYVSNGSCTEGVREVGCERFHNINGRSIDNGASGNDYPREVGNKESNMRRINERTNATNAWKKPVHVQVDWQNQGKASTDGKFVNLNIENVNSNRSKLEKALVGKLIGRRLPFHILSSELQKRWQSYGEFKCMLTGEESFICLFSSAEARDAVLMGGPWLIGGYVIGLDKWSPEYTHDSICGLTAPVWIRFPKLPLLYWDNDNLARIASMVGQPLWIDALTSELGRCAFARVCVRLDFGIKLPTGVWIPGINGNFFQKVEYEGIKQVCFRCGHIGHKVESCVLSKKTNVVEACPLNRDNAVFGWKKGNQEGVHKMNVREGSISNVKQVPSKVNTNIPMEVGECSNSETQTTDTIVINSTTDADEDAVYGPWIYVSRKKNKFKNGVGKFATSKKDNFKKKNVPDMGKDKLASFSENEKRIQFSDQERFNQDKVVDRQGVGLFTSTRNQVGKLSNNSRPNSLKIGNGKGAVSFCPIEKEPSILASFNTWSRKRRKEIDFDADAVFGFGESEGGNAAQETVVQGLGSNGGGDASPIHI